MITRHDFLALAGTALTGLALTACESRQADDGTVATTEQADETVEATAQVEEATEEAQQDATEPASTSGDAIVVYFSRADENYGVGFIEEGNTAILAKMVAERTGADLFEIVPAEPYPEGYDDCCDVALEEQHQGARPAFASDTDISAYTDVYLGYPIWWGDLPMCVYTFLEAHDWAAHTIHPFCTHAGSGLAGTPEKIASTCAGAQVADALAMPGTTAQNSRDEAAAEVDTWLNA